MSIENWVQVFVPIVGLFIAIVSAALSYYFAKKQQILADERRLKEKSYLEYIDAISNNVLSDDLEASKSRLAKAHNQILLIGNADVVRKLRDFTEYAGSSRIVEFNQTEHDRLVTELIKSMRIDLYKAKTINYSYPQIGICGKNKQLDCRKSIT